MTTKTCPHCGTEMHAPGLPLHLRACVANPVVARRLRAMLHYYSVDGCMMSLTDYQDVSTSWDAPSTKALRTQIGNWAAVTAWAELKPHRSADTHAALYDGATADPDLPITPHWLSAIPAYRTIRKWDGRTWAPAAIATAWLLR